MKRTGKCPKCLSNDVVADAQVIDRADYNVHIDLSTATFRRPDAVLFKEKQATKVSAWVCAACGYVEFYADDPGIIRRPEA